MNLEEYNKCLSVQLARSKESLPVQVDDASRKKAHSFILDAYRSLYRYYANTLAHIDRLASYKMVHSYSRLVESAWAQHNIQVGNQEVLLKARLESIGLSGEISFQKYKMLQSKAETSIKVRNT